MINDKAADRNIADNNIYIVLVFLFIDVLLTRISRVPVKISP